MTKLILTDDINEAPIRISERSTEPLAPNGNDIYMDDGTNTVHGNPGLRRYTGTAWEDVGGSSGGGSGVSVALDNLAGVAINTSLISDTDNTDDLGSAAIQWKNVYAKAIFAALKASVYNDSGAAIGAEKAVYFSGHDATNDVPEISQTDRDAASSLPVVGMTQASINNLAMGEIITYGIATYPTTGMAVGDTLYADSNAGLLTNSKPTTGLLQEVATVIEVGGTGAGRIFVNPKHVEDLDAGGGSVSKVVATNTFDNTSINSTSLNTMQDSDATNHVITAVLNGGGVTIVTFTFRAKKELTGSSYYRISDGTINSDEYEKKDGSTYPITLVAVFENLPAGSRTFKLQFRSDDANLARVNTGKMTMNLVEIS